MADGPAAALPIVDDLIAAGSLSGSHLLPSVRGELLSRLGRTDEARAELERAVGLCGNDAERALLQNKIARSEQARVSRGATPARLSRR